MTQVTVESFLSQLVRTAYADSMTPEIQEEIECGDLSALANRMNDWLRNLLRQSKFISSQLIEQAVSADDAELMYLCLVGEYRELSANHSSDPKEKKRLEMIVWAIEHVFCIKIAF